MHGHVAHTHWTEKVQRFYCSNGDQRLDYVLVLLADALKGGSQEAPQRECLCGSGMAMGSSCDHLLTAQPFTYRASFRKQINLLRRESGAENKI